MKLSNLLKHTFYKYPLDHSLNINNFEKFIDACNPKVREICIILLQNTIHISFETFLISGKVLARYRLLPDSKTKGLFGAKPMVVYTSEESHYSVLKGANW